jgi:hypothetical protein
LQLNFTAKNAMPARYVFERADWVGAATLPFKPSQYPPADSIVHFARGVGMARSGDLPGAKAEIDAIKALRDVLEKVHLSYWADRSEEQILAIQHGSRSRRVTRIKRLSSCALDGSWGVATARSTPGPRSNISPRN